jgi:hypothetical protein
VAKLFKKLNQVDMDLDNMRQLKDAAARNSSVLRDLIPVAAQLSADHMRWWLSIAESVGNLAEATDNAAVTFATHKFLINLGEFDDLHL